MHHRLNLPAAAVVMTLFAGCASSPENIPGSFVSPQQYSGQECGAIATDYQMVITDLEDAEQRQRQAMSTDVTLGLVGFLIFWPAWVALPLTPDHRDEVADLKGERAALAHAAHANDCPVMGPLYPLGAPEADPVVPSSPGI